jgi:hypothetical protein
LGPVQGGGAMLGGHHKGAQAPSPAPQAAAAVIRKEGAFRPMPIV